MNNKINWFYKYLGKPWQAVPTPPESYNCGELVRAIYKNELNIELPAILIDNARNRRQCIEAMQPDVFGFLPLSLVARHKDFDLILLGRKRQLSHCGLIVNTNEGEKVLHCPEAACGVCLDSFIELHIAGFPFVSIFRHKKFIEDDNS